MIDQVKNKTKKIEITTEPIKKYIILQQKGKQHLKKW